MVALSIVGTLCDRFHWIGGTLHRLLLKIQAISLNFKNLDPLVMLLRDWRIVRRSSPRDSSSDLDPPYLV